MWISKVFLRWYKSFNTVFHSDIALKPWDRFADAPFPFVQIPLDQRITTIVGGNESGKSHLLSAVAKGINGLGIDREAKRGLVVQDICRHCSFDSLDRAVSPSIGLEITFEGKAENDSAAATLAGVGLGRTSSGSSLTVVLDRADESKFATFYDSADELLGAVTESAWYDYASKRLPLVRYIDARMGLENQIHVRQLLQGYEDADAKPEAIGDHLKLNEIANDLRNVQVPDKDAQIGELATELQTLKKRVNESRLPAPNSVYLETLLFKHILDVPQDYIARINSLGTTDRGYIELVVADINHRISERLDLTSFWTQDDDLTLEVDYKGGYFYFQLRDKTGSKFTFNERSSGLKYFLSYYIQSLAFRMANTDRGTVVLMDEPDGFLSAIAQRNLLRVFESLVRGDAPGRCQLLYTTHSPFLINRNFPQRLRLVRKGDGTEGTQYVKRSIARRYEPVRSALGIDCAETIFMGATNVVVEGLSDQKVLVAGIQKFGKADAIDESIDLNKVTFVSGNGVGGVKRILERSRSDDEKKPVVVVLLDGDTPGKVVSQEIVAEKLANRDVVATLDELELKTGKDQPKVLEDLIPLPLLAKATSIYLNDTWNVSVDPQVIQAELEDPATTMCERLVAVVQSRTNNEAKEIGSIEIRGGITDAFVERLLFSKEIDGTPDLQAFEGTMKKITSGLRKMIECAEAKSRQETLLKNFRLLIDPFIKTHRSSATKLDISKLLLLLADHATGGGDDAGKARGSILSLQELLDTEVGATNHDVDIRKWIPRLEHLRESPFKTPKAGWKTLGESR